MAVEESGKTENNGSPSADPAMSFRARHWMVGTNVVVMVILAGVLFCFVQWFGFTYGSHYRADMTSTGVNSLRQGTVDLVGKLDASITLTNLYHTTDMDEENQKFLKSVNDLFSLYQSVNRSKVETESINPLKDHNQRNELIKRLRDKPKYKEEAARHIELVEHFANEVYPKLKAFLDAERVEVDALIQSDQAFAQLPTATTILQGFEMLGRRADEVTEDVKAALNDEIPQYSAAANRIKDYASGSGTGVKDFLSQIQEKGPNIVKAAGDLTDKTRTFFNNAKERYTEIMAQLADLETRAADLPNLKLEDLRRDLGQSNTIVVETQEDARILSFRDVWPTKQQQGGMGGQDKFQDHYFAGEAQVTSAILQMTSTDKPAVVFAKFGGPPVFTSMGGFNPMQRQPPAQYPNLKKTLERLNYTVKEWDLQASKDSPPTFDPEPSRIIYVALDPDPQPPQMPGGSMMMQQGRFDPAAREALLAKIGDNGRALFLAGWGEPRGMMPIPQPYDYADYLKTTWGINVRSEVVVLSMVSHEPGKWLPRGNPFQTRNWKFGNSVIAESIRTMPGSFPNAAPINRVDTLPEGVEITDLVTVDASDEVWGESDIMSLQQEFRKLNYSKGPDQEKDVSGPFPIAVSATKGEQKIVVISSNRFATDIVAGQQSLMLAGGGGGVMIQKVNPANEPFFVNCIQWLNDNEEQIGLGAVTEFAESRLTIEEGSALTAWKWFAWAGWPAMTLFVGMGAWFVRRR